MKHKLALLGLITTLLAASPALPAEPSGYRMPAVKIAVADYQRSIDFYTKLGMKVGTKYNPLEQQLTWDDPSQGSSIILVRDESGRIKVTPGAAFLVFGVPDIKATAQQLKEAGYENVGEPRNMRTFLILMTEDPDGNRIELLQRVTASAE